MLATALEHAAMATVAQRYVVDASPHFIRCGKALMTSSGLVLAAGFMDAGLCTSLAGAHKTNIPTTKALGLYG